MEVEPVFRGRKFKAKNDLCFVLMPLHDPFTSIFEQHIKPVAAKCGLNAVKADDIYSNKPVMEDVWAYLNEARLVIADLTDSNPNVFYELGIAHTLGKEVIMVAQHIVKVPFDVGHVRYINYVFPSKVAEFEKQLQATITQVLKDSTVEVRFLEQETKLRGIEKGQASSAVRLQRLASLTDWARDRTKNNLLILVHLGRYEHETVSTWSVFERINSETRTEAVRRWGLSSGTAKDYADTVMLAIRPEFERQMESEIEKEEKSKIRLRGYTSTTPLRIAWEWLDSIEYQAKSSDFVFQLNALIAHINKESGLTLDQANNATQDLIKMGAINEVRSGVYKRISQ